MKKTLLGLLLAAPLLAQAQAPAPFTIKGQLGKLPAKTKVFLRNEKGIIDSAEVKNGAFVLKGTVAEPTQVRLMLLNNGNRYRLRTGQADHTIFYLEKGAISLVSPDSLGHAAITGTPLNADFQQLQALLKPGQDQLNALYATYRAMPKEQRTPEFQAKSDAQEEALDQIINQQYAAFVRTHPGSAVSLDAVRDMGGPVPNYAEVAPLFALLTPAVQSSPSGQRYAAELAILKTVSVGAVAPDFTLPTPEGKAVALSSLRGQFVLVDFWANWCGPCRQENPNVVKAYNAFKSRNFTVLGVSLDEAKDREKWLKAIATDQLPWTQVSGLDGWKGEAATRYHIQAIPQNFLIDPSGKIVAVNLRGTALQTTLAQLLK
ncbi:TlpA disulfide reductase family protein [Hymenobacter actinosclerus]|uniref:Peroxiredoxin n=1 Tax=Hymenobacter actinosclerus TaxID=82805 RepID=A0A1I0GK61_9BACT|nr:TlpA disulfide reductase family protein [Hymenobacter actinosclerus]SET71333.1 Peroxiredoxin [Hymenobacter actinosclerus]